MIPTSIDGTDITGATIDGQDVTEITVDGDTVFTAGVPVNRLYVAESNNNVITQYDLNNKFDLTGATETATFGVAAPRDVVIADSGNKVAIASGDGGNDRHEMYDLSTPYDIGSAGSVVSTLSETRAHGIDIDPSGTHLMAGNDTGQQFKYYTLGTAFDLSTASFQDSVSTSDFAYEVDYVDSGEYMYGVVEGYVINRWTLSTPYDFTTRSSQQTYSIPSFYRGMHVTEDGSKYFAGDLVDGEVYEYNLGTAYDISSRGSIIDTITADNAFGIDLV